MSQALVKMQFLEKQWTKFPPFSLLCVVVKGLVWVAADQCRAPAHTKSS